MTKYVIDNKYPHMRKN